jgi:hypothetical protein
MYTFEFVCGVGLIVMLFGVLLWLSSRGGKE